MLHIGGGLQGQVLDVEARHAVCYLTVGQREGNRVFGDIVDAQAHLANDIEVAVVKVAALGLTRPLVGLVVIGGVAQVDDVCQPVVFLLVERQHADTYLRVYRTFLAVLHEGGRQVFYHPRLTAVLRLFV